MNKLKYIKIIALCVFYSNTHAQSIESVNYALDSIYYYYHYASNFDYDTQIQLPDSTKQKVINVLNGYLPPQKIKEASTFSDAAIRDIEKRTKKICGEDSLCNALAKDSIMKSYIEHQLEMYRKSIFSDNFILAIGAWNITEAEPILLENINNPKYPQEETLLALAKLGNDSIYKQVMERYTLKYVINNTVLKDNDPDLVYRYIPAGEQISHRISDFYNAAKYLKNKDILFNMIDLLDIQGKVSGAFTNFQTLIPIELNTLAWLETRFMSKELIENGKQDEWEKIINDYYDSIDKYKNAEKIIEILSKENKEIVKKQLRDWIIKNVNFE